MGKRPTIAILTNYPYDGMRFSGGVETATSALLEGLHRYSDDFDFHIIALSRDIRQTAVESREGVNYHFVAVPAQWYARPHLFPNIINAQRALKSLHPDLVHCQDNLALAVAARRFTGPKLFTVHGIKSVESRVWQGPEFWSHKMDALLERWARNHFKDVVTVSSYVDQFLPSAVRKYHIANPVNRAFFEEPHGKVERVQILFVGVLTRLKRPLDVLRAFHVVRKELPSASLLIAGEREDADYFREMERFILDEHLEGVTFLGTVSRDDIRSLMRESMMLVLASVQENTPMVIAEAMASGVPVVASNVGGVPYIVEDGHNGLLFECGNTVQLADAIVRLAHDEQLRNSMSMNGRKVAAEHFSPDAVAEKTVALYRSLLGEADG